MFTFIKDYSIDSIKKKLILLYLLNVFDVLMTLILLRTGYFREANIFMVKMVESPLASFLFKVVFPALLLTYLYTRIKQTAEVSEQDELATSLCYEELKVSNIGILISLTIYTLVDLSHLVWTALLPFFLIRAN